MYHQVKRGLYLKSLSFLSRFGLRKIGSRLFFIGLFVIGCFVQSFAWNKPGHMTTGAIAYFELKANSPDTLKKVVALLKELPDYETHWKTIVADRTAQGDDEGLVLFAYAARWADDIRGNPAEHRGLWHYINYPFKPDSEPGSVKTVEPANDNIEKAFEYNLGVLKDPKRSDPERAKALCWIFHLAGDAHQPLHTVSLFSSVFNTAEGDRGGTRFFVRVTETNATTNLHSLWDGAVIGADNFQSVKNRATILRNFYNRAKLKHLDEPDFKKWIAESFELAKEKVYLNGLLKGTQEQTKVEILPPEYVNEMKAVAERRVAMAGYRLADLLKISF